MDLTKLSLFGTTNIFAFTGLAYLYFLPPLLKDAKDFKSVSIISIISSAICIIISIASLILTFPVVIQLDETLSIYLLTRMLEFGDFLERLDAIFFFIWFLLITTFLSLTFFYILRIFKKLTNVEDVKALSSPLAFIVLGSSLSIRNYSEIKFLGTTIYKYFCICLVFGISLIILVLANIKYKRKNNKN